MKEFFGLLIVGLFGLALWKTHQAATTSPRCPTVDELDGMTRDILDGKSDLADAETLAKTYDAIPGCGAAATAIRAAILAKKSASVTSTDAPPLVYKRASDLGALLGKAAPVDPAILLVDTSYGKGVDPLSVDALSSPMREDAKYLLAKPRAEWTSADLAVYGALAGVGKPVSPACGGLQVGLILDDWLARRAFQCDPTIDEYKAGARKTVLADHPDNALSLLWAHAGGA